VVVQFVEGLVVVVEIGEVVELKKELMMVVVGAFLHLVPGEISPVLCVEQLDW